MIPRLFIVDDEAPARARLAMLLSDIAADCPHLLVGEAADPQSALEGIAAVQPDIVLLDVQMPGMTGLELAGHLQRSTGKAPAVVFISAFDEYAIKAFEVQALDYLLKPVRAARLADAIRRAASLVQAQTQPAALAALAAQVQDTRKNFSVQERGRVLLVPIGDVIYLKAEAKYVTLRTASRDYLIEESLNSIEEELGSVFVRVHRNALVSRAAIIGVERAAHGIDAEGETDRSQEAWQVILRGAAERLPISRRQWPVVKALVKPAR
jgi:two-component system response regulator AlgR